MAWKKISGFLRNNALSLASAFIAAMGLLVAWMSLHLAITSQREEREHKELLLRPALVADVDLADYSVSVSNVGLGPALITDTLQYLDGQCIQVSRGNVDEFIRTNLSRAYQQIGRYFTEQMAAKWKEEEFKSIPTFHVTVPLPSQIVAVGKDFSLFRLDTEAATEVKARVSQMKLETRNAFNDEFLRRLLSIPITVRYCSMSEMYCPAPVLHIIPCQFSTQ